MIEYRPANAVVTTGAEAPVVAVVVDPESDEPPLQALNAPTVIIVKVNLTKSGRAMIMALSLSRCSRRGISIDEYLHIYAVNDLLTSNRGQMKPALLKALIFR